MATHIEKQTSPKTKMKLRLKSLFVNAANIAIQGYNIKGEVVYSREGQSGMFESGIRFLETNEKINQIVDNLVEVFSQKKSL